MDIRVRSSRILMFPWLAHGHISPMLQLAKSLTKRNFIIYLCSSHINLNSIRKNLSEKESISIKLVELQIPITPDFPPHYHTTNGLPPHLMSTLKLHLDAARPAFAILLETLKPDFLIYDFLQPWAPEEARSQNIPAVAFFSTGAAVTSFLMHKYFKPETEYPFPAIYFRECEYSHYSHLVESSETNDNERLRDCVNRSSDIVLIKTFRGIEGKYIDFLSDLTGKKFVPVGPLVQDSESTLNQNGGNEIIQWLDQKHERSTIFASFGSEYFLSEEEIEAIAIGLELCGFNFIWVLRFPVGDEKIKIGDKLPLGFFDRVGERGKVVEGWVPQREIISHKNIGGFISHCGWSSVMEAIYFCVPIIAVPMHLDQPMNARLVEEGGFGEEVVRNKDGKLDGGEVARVVKKVMTDEKLRRRIEELREEVRGRGKEEIDKVVEELVAVRQKMEKLALMPVDSMKELNSMIMDREDGLLNTNA